MSEQKFTPGPWCEMPNESDKPYARIRGTRLGGRFKVANVLKMPAREGEPESDAEETRANARLIAAAPELFEAARIGLQYIEAVCFNTPNPKKRANYADAASIIRAAIAKATGS